MMIKIVKHFMLMQFDARYMNEPEYFYSRTDMQSLGDESYSVIKEVDFEMVIPDDFDPRNQMIATLERHRTKAKADFELLMTTLDGKIQQLKCIEHKPAPDLSVDPEDVF